MLEKATLGRAGSSAIRQSREHDSGGFVTHILKTSFRNPYHPRRGGDFVPRKPVGEAIPLEIFVLVGFQDKDGGRRDERGMPVRAISGWRGVNGIRDPVCFPSPETVGSTRMEMLCEGNIGGGRLVVSRNGEKILLDTMSRSRHVWKR